MSVNDYGQRLGEELSRHGVADSQIANAVRSGYIIRDWCDPFSGRTWSSVSDRMYGNKQGSSSFDIDKFANHLITGEPMQRAPEFRRFTVRNRSELDEVLSEPRRAHYLNEGSLWFRGQTKEYTFRRSVPNPFRVLSANDELSIVPGIYRQNGGQYDFSIPVVESSSFKALIGELAPDYPGGTFDQLFSNDPVRAEQHYATQTRGLDVTPDIDSALFFATNRFLLNDSQQAFYQKVPAGENEGVVYCFRFCSPAVKRSDYMINEFTLYKAHRPERILRQKCGLPMFGDDERNIATTDIDCIIKLASDFDWEHTKTPRYMFPPTSEDPFYRKILELKHMHRKSGLLSSIVEYEWAYDISR